MLPEHDLKSYQVMALANAKMGSIDRMSEATGIPSGTLKRQALPLPEDENGSESGCINDLDRIAYRMRALIKHGGESGKVVAYLFLKYLWDEYDAGMSQTFENIVDHFADKNGLTNAWKKIGLNIK